VTPTGLPAQAIDAATFDGHGALNSFSLAEETALGVETSFQAQRGKTQIIFGLDKPATCLTLGISHHILANVPVIRCSRYQAMVRCSLSSKGV
jgi:hypothetical protein